MNIEESKKYKRINLKDNKFIPEVVEYRCEECNRLFGKGYVMFASLVVMCYRCKHLNVIQDRRINVKEQFDNMDKVFLETLRKECPYQKNKKDIEDN